MMRRLLLVLAVAVSMSACTGVRPETATPTTAVPASTTPSAVSTTPSAVSTMAPADKPNAQDEVAILTMYADITTAFQRNADDGVRAVIAAQYPGDAADVDFLRCVHALAPGASTLPSSARLQFSPKLSTMTPDPNYTVTSAHVKSLHPKGRIYVTEVTITKGVKATVHERHQVILNGKAYQFSAC